MAALLQPDRAALEIAHRKLHVDMTLDDMLNSRTFRPIIVNVARIHMERRAKFDTKRAQANDIDEVQP